METPSRIVNTLPHAPGVYIYKNTAGQVIYVGKAKDLKKRVSQYFRRDAVGEKTALLVSNIATIETILTVSEFDALLLEAKLIHEYQPKYNVVLKDDKSPLYVLLTLSDKLPRVLVVRRSDLPSRIKPQDALFGPFQSAHIVRSLLRHLRRSIPYCTQKRRTGRPCFYTHLNLCYPCPSAITCILDSEARREAVKKYRSNIFRLKAVLSGKSKDVVRDLEREMRRVAKNNEFEKAKILRQQSENLRYMLTKRYDPAVYIESDTAVEDIYEKELATLLQILRPHIPSIRSLTRIECMDISNTSGQFATGSMVVLTQGRKDTNEYRRFRIRTVDAPNDFAMMSEVITRRLRHREWTLPNLLVIDGGKGQVGAVVDTINRAKLSQQIPVIGLAKRYEEIIVPLGEGKWKTIRLPLTSGAIHALERIRDEAHRFAITYHKTLRARSFV